MWVSRRRWRELWDTAAKATHVMFERDQFRERVAELESENASLLAWLRQAQNPGDVRLLDTARRYEPREYGTGDLDVSEAPVAACPDCGMPHPVSQPCAGQIKEAA